ncbi:MAG: non-ribosomal peptide synthetase, partial [bacterium]|nr:non-ribosomal peptide synthetase [bacterium]
LPQKRLYILQQMTPQSTAYNMPQLIRLQIEPQKQKIETLFLRLIKRHDSLRTRFYTVGETPVQQIRPMEDIRFQLEYIEMENRPVGTGNREGEGESKKGFTGTVMKDFIRTFDLTRAPLLRAALVKTRKNRHLLLFDMHHIISDGVSMTILTREFLQMYEGDQLAELKLTYKDYVQWQNSKEQTKAIRAQEHFWLTRFSGEISPLKLPIDYPRPAVQGFEGSAATFSITKTEMEKIKTICETQNVTLYTVLLAFFYILLYKLTYQEDIVVGTPASGRRHVDLEHIIGMFVNTLAIRNRPAGEKSFKTFLAEMKQEVLSALENQDYPFENLVEKIYPTRDLSRNPLFDTMFTFRNQAEYPGIENKITPGEEPVSPGFESRISKFDMTLNAIETRDAIDFTLQYCTRLFKKETIGRFISYFKKTVTFIAENPESKLSEVEILSHRERERLLLDFNHTGVEYPVDKTIHGLFEEQA